MNKKTIYLVSLGCPKNLVDSELILSTATLEGYKITDNIKEAGIVVINTCSFIKSARRESFSVIKEACKSAGSKKVIVAGCLVEMMGEEIKDKIPEVTHVVGIGEIDKFKKIITAANPSSREKKARVLFPTPSHPRILTGYGHYAYIKISDGCSRKCSFCTIPSIRGRLISRRVSSIVREAKELLACGVKELVLVSQDTTSFGRGSSSSKQEDLLTLLKKLAGLDGIKWIRLMYLYPDRTLKKIFTFMKESDSLLPYIDLPIQHFSDRMLKIMNRGYRSRLIAELICNISSKIPHAAIRTTLLVGHPGEKLEDFQKLIEFIQKYQLEKTALMPYSDEIQTKSSAMKEKVSPGEIKRRMKILSQLISEVLDRKYSKLVGKELTAIVDEIPRKDSGYIKCRAWNQAPEIDGHILVKRSAEKLRCGDFIKVKITGFRSINLHGYMTCKAGTFHR